MTRAPLPHPDQLPLELATPETLEREVERRVAARCEQEAARWRLRLVLIETVMMGALVATAGMALDQPGPMVARAALIVAASCFASGSLLLGLSICGGRLLRHVRHGRPS